MNREQAHLRSAARYNREGNVRKAIAHFGRAVHYRAQQFGGLPPCKYGASCYRKNPDHFKEFSHPGPSVPDTKHDSYVELERRIKNADTVTDSRYQQVSGSYDDIEKAIKDARLKRTTKRPKDDARRCSAGGQCTIIADDHIENFSH